MKGLKKPSVETVELMECYITEEDLKRQQEENSKCQDFLSWLNTAVSESEWTRSEGPSAGWSSAHGMH